MNELTALIETLMDPDTSRLHYDVALLAYEALVEAMDAHDGVEDSLMFQIEP